MAELDASFLGSIAAALRFPLVIDDKSRLLALLDTGEVRQVDLPDENSGYDFGPRAAGATTGVSWVLFHDLLCVRLGEDGFFAIPRAPESEGFCSAALIGNAAYVPDGPMSGYFLWNCPNGAALVRVDRGGLFHVAFFHGLILHDGFKCSEEKIALVGMSHRKYRDEDSGYAFGKAVIATFSIKNERKAVKNIGFLASLRLSRSIQKEYSNNGGVWASAIASRFIEDWFACLGFSGGRYLIGSVVHGSWFEDYKTWWPFRSESESVAIFTVNKDGLELKKCLCGYAYYGAVQGATGRACFLIDEGEISASIDNIYVMKDEDNFSSLGRMKIQGIDLAGMKIGYSSFAWHDDIGFYAALMLIPSDSRGGDDVRLRLLMCSADAITWQCIYKEAA